MKAIPLPKAERVRELLDYSADSGLFVWKSSRGPRPAGSLAGSPHHDGYRYIMIDGSRYSAHRLAFLHVHGRAPIDQIDHINCIRDDNRLANLRECSNAENKQNMKRARADNRTGLLGVFPDRKRFRACIARNGKTINLGTHDTPEEAHSAYVRAKGALHPFAPVLDGAQ